jgi:tetratricopeptide (TPR) repeat protein
MDVAASDLRDGELPVSLIEQALRGRTGPAAEASRFDGPAWLDGGARPECAKGDTGDGCGQPVDVVWAAAGGVEAACASHWPVAMLYSADPSLLAAWSGSTWMRRGVVAIKDVGRHAAAQFYRSSRARVVPLLPEDVAQNYFDVLVDEVADLRMGVLIWAMAVTNPSTDFERVVVYAQAVQGRVEEGGARVVNDDVFSLETRPGAAARVGSSLTAEELVLDEASDGPGWYTLGRRSYEAGDRAAALECWTRAADEFGHVMSMRRLAERTDEALAWLERAAGAGDAGSMGMLGGLYMGRKDYARAVPWLRAAADLDEPIAMYNLGALAFQHDDLPTARAWWERSAALGDPDAAAGLAGLAAGSGARSSVR